MTRFPAALLAVALIVSACTSDSQTGSEPTEPEPTTTTSTASTTTIEEAATPSVDAGRLAIVDLEGNVAVVDPDGSNRVQITTDAGEAVYGQPVWSPDSTTLAYSKLTEDSAAVLISRVGGEASTVVPMGNLPFYMNWAPDGQKIGVLHNGRQGLDFEVVDVATGENTIIDQGTPYYFSWSPQGDRVAIHEGPDRFETVDLGGDREDLGETDPGYLVPQWLPQGILHVVDGTLVLDDGQDRTQLAEVNEQTFFVANQQGTLLAVQSLGDADGLSIALGDPAAIRPNTVSVVDMSTGEVVVADSDPAIGFWWSPDGESLLILGASRSGEEVLAKVWTSDGTLTEYARYEPSPIQVRDLFPFFPQYAQSMTFWAPDSSGFALAGRIDGETGIWVQSVGGGAPQLVADGLWVDWSR